MPARLHTSWAVWCLQGLQQTSFGRVLVSFWMPGLHSCSTC